MAGETVITIIGNLTSDPEVRTIGNGSNVASFTIASTPRVFNRQSNQYEDGAALFMRCSAWRDLADHCAHSLSKGMRVIATGRLQQRSYQAKDGSQRTIIDMQVDEIGPSLRYATAHVVHQQSNNNGFQPNYGQQNYGQGVQNYGQPANPMTSAYGAAQASQTAGQPAVDPWSQPQTPQVPQAPQGEFEPDGEF